jgi:hypothetical protein
MEYRRNRAISLLIAATALGSVLSAAPAGAAVSPMHVSPAHVSNAAVRCVTRVQPGHWVRVNGRRVWVAPRSVRVCR